MRCIVPVLVFLVAISIPAQAQATWHRVASEVCGFSALFPGDVQKQERTSSSGGTQTSEEQRFLAVDGKRGFLAFCSVMPEGSLSQMDASDVLTRAVRGLGTTVGPITNLDLDGYPGRAFVAPMDGGHSYGRAYVFGDVVLMLQAIDPDAGPTDAPDDARRFLESVQLAAND